MESLEGRLTPTAIFTVNSLADTAGAGSDLTLRDVFEIESGTLKISDLTAGQLGQIQGTPNLGQDSAIYDEVAFAGLAAGADTLDLTSPLTLQAGSLSIGPGIEQQTPVIDGGGQEGIIVDSAARLELTGLTITDNRSLNSGSLQANDCHFTNSPQAILNRGDLLVTDSTFTGNHANDGGAIENFYLSHATISASTFSDNTADSAGGAIYDLGSTILDECTFSDNQVPSSISTTPEGGAIFQGGGPDGSGTLTVRSSTLSGDSAADGQGNEIYAGRPVTLDHTIIDSPFIRDTSGTKITAALFGDGLYSASYCVLLGAPSTAFSSTDHCVQGDAMLAPLGDYGGNLETMALLPGSPAIDAGGNAPAGETTDARGFPRTVGSAMDIGAFESSGFDITALAGSNQRAALDAAFDTPLTVAVTALDPGAPVAGGLVTFAAPTSGASAHVTSIKESIGTNGQASVLEAANGLPGQYSLTASAGAAGSADFHLANLDTRPTVVSTGGPYLGSLEGGLFLTASVSDPDPGQTLTVTWDINGDGSPDARATAQSNGGTVTLNAQLTAAQLVALVGGESAELGLGPMPGPFTVHVQANDGFLPSALAETTLNIVRGPEGGMKNNGPAFAGQGVSVQVFVPDGESASGPLHFSIALDQSALATTYGGASTDDTQTFTFDSPGTYTAYGRMFQADGAFSDYSTTIDVFAAGQQNALFVDRVYNDLLGRSGSPNGPDSSGPAYWASQLQNGASRQDVALAIMSNGEYDADLVQTAFQQYLHRDAEKGAIDCFAPLLARGLSPEQLDLDLVDSPEYFAARGGGSNDGFLDALFADALGRAVDAGARTAFDTMFANGATPAQVADLVFGSAEYENGLVQNMFESLLNRPADPAALAFFAGELSSGLTDQQVMAQIIGSDEFAPLA